MEQTLDSEIVKAQFPDRVLSPTRSHPYHSPIIMGVIGALALFALYLLIVTIAQDGQHAIELFLQDAWLVIPITIGFGIQVGLYTYLRNVLKQKSRRSKMLMGAGGGTSTVAMIACCAHHVTDLLPLLGLSAAASFLAAYKIPFMLIGLAMNVIGIVVILRTIHREQHHLDHLNSMESH